MTYPYACPKCGLRGRISREQRDHELPIHCPTCGYQKKQWWRTTANARGTSAAMIERRTHGDD